MLIRIRDTGDVLTESQFRTLHNKTVSFTETITFDQITGLGADPVLETPVPAFDPDTQLAYQNGAVQDTLGNWVINWAVRDLTEEERAARLPTVEQYVAALEAVYDQVAQSHKYDNRFTCALRAGYVGPFQAEGIAFATWMDTCNAQAYAIMEQVLTQEIPQPSIAGLLAMLPAMVWP